MMIHIVLKNGKVLRYNDANSCEVKKGVYLLCDLERTYLIASIPIANVERAEFSKPCAILREAKTLKRKRVY